jgi:hypothetical protein
MSVAPLHHFVLHRRRRGFSMKYQVSQAFTKPLPQFFQQLRPVRSLRRAVGRFHSETSQCRVAHGAALGADHGFATVKGSFEATGQALAETAWRLSPTL